ncbi:MAG TPA: hypothetical protein DDW62_03045 [Marinilabiliaceae bacterium]|nr:hypothetical protein [Marinilabiliaceae bacterium]
MRRLLIVISLYFALHLGLNAQGRQLTGMPQGSPATRGAGAALDSEAAATPPGDRIKHIIKNWHLADQGTRADSVPVDTLSAGFQIFNPAYRAAIANVQLGNIGAAWMPAMVSEMSLSRPFVFVENLRHVFTPPEEWLYFNTTTPYTNLYYQYSGPKARSEEVLSVLFTQNINRKWNFGFNYDLTSSIGKYNAQKVDNRHFRFFSSYSGEKYEVHGGYVYNKAAHLENGGIVDEDHVLNPDSYDWGKSNNIPVRFYSASNRVDNHRLYLNQALKIGTVAVGRREDQTTKMPLGTAIHSLHINRNRRVHQIDNLAKLINESEGDFFYKNIYADSTATRDSVYYTSVSNTIQLKFNEEANALLRFGLRAYITNEIESYKFPVEPLEYGNFSTPPKYRLGDDNSSTTLIGGQIFKNLGQNFRWNAGMRFFFQGYRSGDSELTGAAESRFRVMKDSAAVFANGGLYLTSPSFFETRYYSNHFKWSENFDKVQTMRLGGGVKIPTRRLELTTEARFINDYVFWNNEALPEQTSAFLTLIEFKLFKHFTLANLHSKNTILYQISSHQTIVPLPEWSIYSSNYFENKLFKVLFFQLGFDLRYNSSWYAPAYMPATGRFYVQNQRKVGDYPFVDVFLNMQLKRARIFIKYDHVNMGTPSNQYFHTVSYPASPRALRFGVSWNFYD